MSNNNGMISSIKKRKFNFRLAFILLLLSSSVAFVIIILYFLIRGLCITAPDLVDPISFQVSLETDGAVRASWDVAPRATRYFLYLKSGSPPSESIYDKKVETTLTTYRFTDLTVNSRWYISLQPANNCGTSSLTPAKFIIPCSIVGQTEIISAEIIENSRLIDYPYKMSIKRTPKADKYTVQIYEIDNQVSQKQDKLVANQTFFDVDCQDLFCDFNQISLTKFPEVGLDYRFEVTPLNYCNQGIKKTLILTLPST